MSLSAKRISELVDLIVFMVDAPGDWLEKKKQILNEICDDDVEAIYEFAEWFHD